MNLHQSDVEINNCSTEATILGVVALDIGRESNAGVKISKLHLTDGWLKSRPS